MTEVLEQWGLLEEVHKRSCWTMNTVKFYSTLSTQSYASYVLTVGSLGDGDELLGQHTYTDEILMESGGGHWIFLSVRVLLHLALFLCLSLLTACGPSRHPLRRCAEGWC